MNRLNILNRFLEPIGSCLTSEVVRRLLEFRADTRTQKRFKRLTERNKTGTLTESERVKYDTLLSVLDFVTVLRAKARGILKREGQA